MRYGLAALINLGELHGSPILLEGKKMNNVSIGFVVCMLSMFVFCMALVFGPAVMEGHHVLAILLLSMFGIGIGGTNL
jgi:hypothetical protein